METKPFYKTSEWWLTVIAQLLTVILQLRGVISPEVGASIQTGGAGFYALARGIAKAGVPARP